MFLTLDDYHPITNDFRPYFFERDPYTGKYRNQCQLHSSLLPIPNHLKQVEHALYIMPYRLLIPQCKFQIENIFFGFLKTWLLIAIFYSGSLYAAGYMFLTLDDYHRMFG
jgi:hypothetical protein